MVAHIVSSVRSLGKSFSYLNDSLDFFYIFVGTKSYVSISIENRRI
jgi:hypothetical protein